jgi:hypothetical protein
MQAALDRWGDPFGDHPFTTEQVRIVQRLVERVDVREDALVGVRIRAEWAGELRRGTAAYGERMAA